MTEHRQARLRAALREREARIAELEQRLAALQSSTALQVGRLLAGAARTPRRRAPRLPRDLYRVWRRRHTSAAGQAAPTAPSGYEQPARPEQRLLTAAPCDGLVVAGVLGRAAAAELAAAPVRVVALYPHDAARVLAESDVDLLLVDAAAGDPGGPWAYLGTPGMYDRELALTEVLRTARARGLPAVLHGGPPPPALAVLDWDPLPPEAKESL